MSLKFYVISLPNSVKRRESCVKTLESLNLGYEIFDATDGNNLSPEDLSLCDSRDENVFTMANGKRIMIREKLSAGETGCALSHLKLYHRILSRGDDTAVIMEDDCILKAPLLEALDNLDVIKTHWDIVNFSDHRGVRNGLFPRRYHFGSDKTQYFEQVGLRCPYLNAVFNSRRFLGMAALYVVRAETCRKLIEFGTPVRVPADMVTGLVTCNGLRVFKAFPDRNHYVDYMSFDSDITKSSARPDHRMIRL